MNQQQAPRPKHYPGYDRNANHTAFVCKTCCYFIACCIAILLLAHYGPQYYDIPSLKPELDGSASTVHGNQKEQLPNTEQHFKQETRASQENPIQKVHQLELKIAELEKLLAQQIQTNAQKNSTCQKQTEILQERNQELEQEREEWLRGNQKLEEQNRRYQELESRFESISESLSKLQAAHTTRDIKDESCFEQKRKIQSIQNDSPTKNSEEEKRARTNNPHHQKVKISGLSQKLEFKTGSAKNRAQNYLQARPNPDQSFFSALRVKAGNILFSRFDPFDDAQRESSYCSSTNVLEMNFQVKAQFRPTWIRFEFNRVY